MTTIIRGPGVLGRTAAAALSLLLIGGAAMAETKAPKKAEPKQQQQPAPAPQQPAPAPQQQAAPAPPPLVYSPWTKICPKPPPNAPATAKPICLTMKEGRLETGQFVTGAALIEQQGEEKRLMRVTLPLTMQLAPGTRMTVDTDPPISAPYIVCVPNGCMAEYQIDAAFIGKLKKGQQLLLQAVDMTNQVVTIPLPLADLAKAVDGPPTDPETYQAAQKAEWEKRLKAQQPQGTSQAPPKQ